jgi:hypothetical protein
MTPDWPLNPSSMVAYSMTLSDFSLEQAENMKPNCGEEHFRTLKKGSHLAKQPPSPRSSSFHQLTHTHNLMDRWPYKGRLDFSHASTSPPHPKQTLLRPLPSPPPPKWR